jgi:small nuclear ribonucleoprotein (snRNP)-like protein
MPFDTDPLTPPTSLEQLKDLLSRAVRVHVKDGRYFEGTFLGVDGKRNLLLSDALESSRGMVVC